MNETVLEIMIELKTKEQNEIFINEPNDVSKINLYQYFVSDKKNIDLLSADNAFARYIIEFYPLCSKAYFNILVKFIIMFREFLNKKNNSDLNKLSSEKNSNFVYSIKDGASKLPEYCNDFVTEFLESKRYLGLELNETIDLIQHFCYWLHENKYTKSILSLLTNN